AAPGEPFPLHLLVLCRRRPARAGADRPRLVAGPAGAAAAAGPRGPRHPPPLGGAPGLKRLLLLLPLLLLAGLIAVFAFSIDRDPNLIRSVLIDKPAPEFALPPLAGLDFPGFATTDLGGTVTVVNVFASWCVPCRDEHPLLE